MSEHFDALETRAPEQRQREQFAALQALLETAVRKAPGLSQRFAGVALAELTDRDALAKAPLLRKSELTAMQAKNPPFGGLTTLAPNEFKNIFVSPGPINEPGSAKPDWWRFGRALYAAGARKGDILHNCFAYHLTPAGAMVESGALAVGCAVLPGGIGATEQQALAAAAIKPTAYGGTPDYLKVILDKGAEMGLDLSSYKRALVSGGALFPSLRAEYAERGVNCLQCYGTADLGLVAYETLGPDGQALPGMVVDEGVIVEIVRPGTSEPVPEGEVGEVVVTTLNPDYPLIRFATGDMSAVMAEPSPCGRSNMRIKGWMGRADQRTKIKGMFVDPAQVDEVVKRHPEIKRARVVVERLNDQDVFKVLVEASTQDSAFAAQVTESVAGAFKLKGAVELVAEGAIPNDGKVIDDQRDYQS